MKYKLDARFRGTGLYWAIVDDKGNVVAEVYLFDGSAATMCEALNKHHAELEAAVKQVTS